MSDRIIFHLAKQLPDLELTGTIYEDFRAGRKTSEWRDASPYWLKRLCDLSQQELWGMDTCNLTDKLKVHRAWFVEGYPKGNLPRLEADVVAVIYHSLSKQLEIQIANVKEVMR